MIKHHGTHTHTALAPTTGNNVPLTGPAPEDLAATTNTQLEIRLKATDSLGKSTTVTRTIDPKTVDLTFDTSPAGLALTVAGTAVTGPQTITSWAGWGRAGQRPGSIRAGPVLALLDLVRLRRRLAHDHDSVQPGDLHRHLQPQPAAQRGHLCQPDLGRRAASGQLQRQRLVRPR